MRGIMIAPTYTFAHDNSVAGSYGIHIFQNTNVNTGVTIKNVKGIHIYSAIGGVGDVTNHYGLWISDISDATALNYAIITGTGLVSFGDDVDMSGSVIFGNELTDQHQATGSLDVTGSFSATDKSFVIPHPEYPDKKLRYGSLEGPEHGIFVRGTTTEEEIHLPSHWKQLARPETITVQLTPIGEYQDLCVTKVEGNIIYVKRKGLLKRDINAFYLVQAERADIDKLKTVY